MRFVFMSMQSGSVDFVLNIVGRCMHTSKGKFMNGWLVVCVCAYLGWCHYLCIKESLIAQGPLFTICGLRCQFGAFGSPVGLMVCFFVCSVGMDTHMHRSVVYFLDRRPNCEPWQLTTLMRYWILKYTRTGCDYFMHNPIFVQLYFSDAWGFCTDLLGLFHSTCRILVTLIPNGTPLKSFCPLKISFTEGLQTQDTRLRRKLKANTSI